MSVKTQAENDGAKARVRKYQMNADRVKISVLSYTVRLGIELKTNRLPFNVVATGYDFLTPKEARGLADALYLAADKIDETEGEQ